MIAVLRSWPVRAWAIAFAAFIGTLIVSGIPTGMITSNLYHRMTPVIWWNYPIWVISALLFAVLAGSYFTGTPVIAQDNGGRGIWAEFVSFIAIGCPICNKIAVALLGVSGALNYFAPVQPILGVVGVALLAWTLWLRLRGQISCPTTFSREKP